MRAAMVAKTGMSAMDSEVAASTKPDVTALIKPSAAAVLMPTKANSPPGPSISPVSMEAGQDTL